MSLCIGKDASGTAQLAFRNNDVFTFDDDTNCWFTTDAAYLRCTNIYTISASTFTVSHDTVGFVAVEKHHYKLPISLLTNNRPYLLQAILTDGTQVEMDGSMVLYTTLSFTSYLQGNYDIQFDLTEDTLTVYYGYSNLSLNDIVEFKLYELNITADGTPTIDPTPASSITISSTGIVFGNDSLESMYYIIRHAPNENTNSVDSMFGVTSTPGLSLTSGGGTRISHDYTHASSESSSNYTSLQVIGSITKDIGVSTAIDKSSYSVIDSLGNSYNILDTSDITSKFLSPVSLLSSHCAVPTSGTTLAVTGSMKVFMFYLKHTRPGHATKYSTVVCDLSNINTDYSLFDFMFRVEISGMSSGRYIQAYWYARSTLKVIRLSATSIKVYYTESSTIGVPLPGFSIEAAYGFNERIAPTLATNTVTGYTLGSIAMDDSTTTLTSFDLEIYGVVHEDVISINSSAPTVLATTMDSTDTTAVIPDGAVNNISTYLDGCGYRESKTYYIDQVFVPIGTTTDLLVVDVLPNNTATLVTITLTLTNNRTVNFNIPISNIPVSDITMLKGTGSYFVKRNTNFDFVVSQSISDYITMTPSSIVPSGTALNTFTSNGTGFYGSVVTDEYISLANNISSDTLLYKFGVLRYSEDIIANFIFLLYNSYEYIPKYIDTETYYYVNIAAVFSSFTIDDTTELVLTIGRSDGYVSSSATTTKDVYINSYGVAAMFSTTTITTKLAQGLAHCNFTVSLRNYVSGSVSEAVSYAYISDYSGCTKHMEYRLN